MERSSDEFLLASTPAVSRRAVVRRLGSGGLLAAAADRPRLPRRGARRPLRGGRYRARRPRRRPLQRQRPRRSCQSPRPRHRRPPAVADSRFWRRLPDRHLSPLQDHRPRFFHSHRRPPRRPGPHRRHRDDQRHPVGRPARISGHQRAIPVLGDLRRPHCRRQSRRTLGPARRRHGRPANRQRHRRLRLPPLDPPPTSRIGDTGRRRRLARRPRRHTRRLVRPPFRQRRQRRRLPLVDRHPAGRGRSGCQGRSYPQRPADRRRRPLQRHQRPRLGPALLGGLLGRRSLDRRPRRQLRPDCRDGEHRLQRSGESAGRASMTK